MGASVVRCDYEDLAKITLAFRAHGDCSRQMLNRLQRQVAVLQNGDWVGEGARAFYHEMDSLVWPSLKRLINALDCADQVTAEINQIMQQAEAEAARVFQAAGQKPAAGTAHYASLGTRPTEPKILSERVGNTLRQLHALPQNKRLAYIQQLRQKDPETYHSIVRAVRNGLPLSEVALPISIDMAMTSPWGQTGEGQAALQQFAQMYSAGKVQFGNVPNDQRAITIPDNVVDTRNGIGSPSTATLNAALANNPEVLAATIAHEALHADRMAKGIEKISLLDSETDAEMAAAKVWASFGQEKFSPSTPAVVAMQEVSLALDPAHPGDDTKMRLGVATEYSYTLAHTGDPANVTQAGVIIEDLLGRGDADQVVKSASDEQVKRMMSAYTDYLGVMQGTPATPARHRSYQLLNGEMDARRLWSP